MTKDELKLRAIELIERIDIQARSFGCVLGGINELKHIIEAYAKHAVTIAAIESGEYVLVPRDSSKYDVQTIMTCPYIIKNVSFREV